MDMKTFRPADNSAVAISAALTLAQEAQANFSLQLTELKQSRDVLLLDGDGKDLALAERKLTEAQGDQERVQSVVAQLTARLETAEQEEAIKRVEDAAKSYADADAARAAWWRKEGPKIRSAIAEGHRLNDEAQNAASDYRNDLRRLAGRDPKLTKATPMAPAVVDPITVNPGPGMRTSEMVAIATPLTGDTSSTAGDFAYAVKLWAENENLDGGVA